MWCLSGTYMILGFSKLLLHESEILAGEAQNEWDTENEWRHLRPLSCWVSDMSGLRKHDGSTTIVRINERGTIC